MRLFTVISLLFITLCGFPQEASNLRTRQITALADTIRLDSLAVVPHSIILLNQKNQPLPDSLFSFITPSSIRISPYAREYLRQAMDKSDSLTIVFRVFPFSLDQPFYRRLPDENRIDPRTGLPARANENPIDRLLSTRGDLKSSGSLSRGISAGNNRDASLQSNLNLQLSGTLSGDFKIEASLSDANIPIQPDGTTQQIQDFDKIYLRIYNPKHEITGGDFELRSASGHFIKLNKKLQGLRYITNHAGEEPRLLPGTQQPATSTALALVKGKYARNKIQGEEGNQGPYLLSGAEGESYLQIIAGSEKVYIDGRLLTRGEDADYVVDYNTAELRFTPRNLITKDRRITVEFEYTERSYARFLAFHESSFNTRHGRLYLQFFSEADAKNQPLLQDLTAEHRDLLQRIGDDLSMATTANIRETGFLSDRVMYKMVDTLVNGIRYDSVLIQSFHPDSAVYQAGFMAAGQGGGHYIQVPSAANGRVYQWVAPVNGIPQGTHEPMIRLVTPRSKQVAVAGLDQRLGKNTRLESEWALSRNDLNSFSAKDREDDSGWALNTRIRRSDTLHTPIPLALQSWVRHRYTGQRFSAVERFREVEFERDWNLQQPVDELNTAENLLEAGIKLGAGDSLQGQYRFEWLKLADGYSGMRHNSDGVLQHKNSMLTWSGSLLNTGSVNRNSAFARHRIEFSQGLGKVLIRLREEHEGNQQYLKQSDSLLPSSFSWQEYQLNLRHRQADNTPWEFNLKYRRDKKPFADQMTKDDEAWDAESWVNLVKVSHHRLRTGLHLRYLADRSDSLDQNLPKFTLTARVEEESRWLNGKIRTQTFYETGSGSERVLDYAYLEVNAGQGVFAWSDYNGNGVQELDEFEVAHFEDQARYIRIVRYSAAWMPTLINRFTQSLTIQPDKGWLKRFSSKLAYRLDKKSAQADFMQALNPFIWQAGDPSSLTLNGQIRHTLSFNKSGAVFGMDLISQKQQSKMMLINGADIREGWSHALLSRYRIHPAVSLLPRIELGEKSFASEYFQSRNYSIGYLLTNIRMDVMPHEHYRLGFEGEYRHESEPSQQAVTSGWKAELSVVRQFTGKGQLEMAARYVRLDYEGPENSPLAYQMLQGLQAGNNLLFRITAQYRLARNLQMDVMYEGRKSDQAPWIHNGQLQVRAIF